MIYCIVPLALLHSPPGRIPPLHVGFEEQHCQNQWTWCAACWCVGSAEKRHKYKINAGTSHRTGVKLYKLNGKILDTDAHGKHILLK